MKKSTGELFELLKASPNVESYLQREADSLRVPALHELLESFLEQKQMKKSRCIAASGIQREYGYQIFSGKRMPERDKIVALCLAMRLSPEETDILLRAGAHHNLYPRSRRDSILINALLKGKTVMDVNGLLYEQGEKILE